MSLPVLISFLWTLYYEERAAVRTELQQLERSRNQSHQSFSLVQTMLARDLDNPEFFTSGLTPTTVALNDLFARKSTALDAIEPALTGRELPQYQALVEAVQGYEETVSALVALLRQRGFQDYGLVGRMRRAVHAVESTLTDPEQQVLLLKMRRHEKDYIIRNQPGYISALHVTGEALARDLQVDPRAAPSARALLSAYRDSFDALVAIDLEIGLRTNAGLYAQHRTQQQHIDALWRQLASDVAQRHEATVTDMQRWLLLATAVIALLALLLATVLSRHLTTPLREMSRGLRQFVRSGFRVPPELSGLRRGGQEMTEIAYDLQRVTDQIMAAIDQLRDEKHRANEANDAKSRFLANMSHELRTPLNGVIGTLDLLEMEASEADRSAHIATIRRSANNLLHMLTEILDFTKIEAGSMAVNTERFAPCEALATLVREFQPVAEDKGIELSFEADVPRHLEAVADRRKWLRLTRNLLHNALKFTPSGAVAVSLSLGSDSGSRVLTVVVEDTGIGMDAQTQEQAWEAFAQQDGSSTRAFGGTGMGLAICRELAQLMDGQLKLRSQPGVGTQVTYIQPVGEAVHEGAGEDAAMHPLKVLVAEDTALNQKIVRRMLERLGCEVEIAANGQEALAAAQASARDLILMDLQMPLMDGLTATAAIRRSCRPAPPIVALTANATAHDRDACEQVGMAGFLTKPITLVELQRTIAGFAPQNALS